MVPKIVSPTVDPIVGFPTRKRLQHISLAKNDRPSLSQLSYQGALGVVDIADLVLRAPYYLCAGDAELFRDSDGHAVEWA